MLKKLFNAILYACIGAFCCYAQSESFPFELSGSESAVGSVYIENLLTGDVIADVNGDLPLIPQVSLSLSRLPRFLKILRRIIAIVLRRL